jgi:hypothetical protein
MSEDAKTRPDSGYRPAQDEPYMNPRQLDYFRAKLEAWRAELIEESEQTLAGAGPERPGYPRGRRRRGAAHS